MIKIEDYNYELPQELIAQEAVEPRDSCKLLCINPSKSPFNKGDFKKNLR
jgi:S-adenosylmethionine:tRNA ribosyltransferase-isomerase